VLDPVAAKKELCGAVGGMGGRRLRGVGLLYGLRLSMDARCDRDTVDGAGDLLVMRRRARRE